MIGWWSSRWGWLTVAINLGTVVAVATTYKVGLILPSLVAGDTTVFSLAYVLAFLPGLWWIIARSNRPAAAETVSDRRGRLATLDLLLALGPPAISFSVLVQNDDQVVGGAARNLLFITAVSVASSEVLSSQFAFLIPVSYLLASGTAGFAFRAPRPSDWALILDQWVPDRDGGVVVVSVIVAICVLISSRLRQPGRRIAGS